MQKRFPSRQRPHEQGQTILLVAISLVSLLAMAALAIDIVTLYAARSEIQRAADAAALAGAKAIADSGITSFLVADATFTTIQPWAQSTATANINAVLQNNLVAGTAPTLVSAPVDWTRQGNPHITVSLRRDNLPTFFSKIWARNAASVTATATAEVYNPANLTTATPMTPIATKSVKPWLVANADPTGTATKFVDTITWAVDSGVIGQTIDLVSDCGGSVVPCGLTDNPPKALLPPAINQVEYVPALVSPNSANICPTSVGACNSSCLGASNYELSVECADANVYSSLNCGNGTTPAAWDNNVNPGGAAGASATGAQCLIHATGPGPSTQDTLSTTLWPGAPMKITGGACSENSGVLVANSSSIVTIPIVDTDSGTFPSTPGNVTIVGFMQAFIKEVDVGGPSPAPPPGSIKITVLNIAGCTSTNNGVTPVVGGSGTSPLPVRLIAPP